MSLAPPPAPAPPPLLRAFRRDAANFSPVQPRAIAGRVAPRGRCLGSLVRAYCVFSSAGSGRLKQEDSRRAPESASGLNKAGFEQWGMENETWQQRGRRGGPCPASGGGGGRSGGGGGGWFRWFISGGFWDPAKQTLLTILGIIAAFFLIANFNVLVGAAVSPLLLVLRQIRRAITFAAYCVSRAMSAPASRPKPTPVLVELAAAPAKGSVGMSAKERVIRKWGSD